jgi:transcriptional regulator with GAF, ATPase, and Fis domain
MPFPQAPLQPETDTDKPFEEAVEDFRRALITNALIRAKYNQRTAAALLGLTYDQFRGYYRKYKSFFE